MVLFTRCVLPRWHIGVYRIKDLELQKKFFIYSVQHAKVILGLWMPRSCYTPELLGSLSVKRGIRGLDFVGLSDWSRIPLKVFVKAPYMHQDCLYPWDWTYLRASQQRCSFKHLLILLWPQQRPKIQLQRVKITDKKANKTKAFYPWIWLHLRVNKIRKIRNNWS